MIHRYVEGGTSSAHWACGLSTCPESGVATVLAQVADPGGDQVRVALGSVAARGLARDVALAAASGVASPPEGADPSWAVEGVPGGVRVSLSCDGRTVGVPMASAHAVEFALELAALAGAAAASRQ